MPENIFDKAENLDINFSNLYQDLFSRSYEKILWQFRRSPVLLNLLKAFTTQSQELYDAAFACLVYRSLSRAEGVNLDILGDIVGQPRTLYNAAEIEWLKPDENTKKSDFSPLWVTNAPLTGNLRVQDITYRKLIIAKIFKNHLSCASAPEIRKFVWLLLGTRISFKKTGTMKVALVVPKDTDSSTVAILQSYQSDPTRIDFSYFLPLAPCVELDRTVYRV